MNKQRRLVLQRSLSTLLIALVLLVATPRPSCSDDSANIELSTAQVDSTIAVIDDLRLDLRLCQIDKLELEMKAHEDSVFAARKLEITKQFYEGYIDDIEGNWIGRLIQHPVVWLAVGVWVGLSNR